MPGRRLALRKGKRSLLVITKAYFPNQLHDSEMGAREYQYSKVGADEAERIGGDEGERIGREIAGEEV